MIRRLIVAAAVAAGVALAPPGAAAPARAELPFCQPGQIPKNCQPRPDYPCGWTPPGECTYARTPTAVKAPPQAPRRPLYRAVPR